MNRYKGDFLSLFSGIISLFSCSFSDEGIEGSFVRGSVNLVLLSEQGTFMFLLDGCNGLSKIGGYVSISQMVPARYQVLRATLLMLVWFFGAEGRNCEFRPVLQVLYHFTQTWPGRE